MSRSQQWISVEGAPTTIQAFAVESAMEAVTITQRMDLLLSAVRSAIERNDSRLALSFLSEGQACIAGAREQAKAICGRLEGAA